MPTVRGMHLNPGTRGGDPLTADVPHTKGGDGFLSTWEVVELTGLSYRMVDYWSRSSEILRATHDAQGSGSRRRWTQDDLARMRKAAVFSMSLSPVMGGGRRSTQGMAVETIERFVREATEFEGGWRWVTEEFDLRVG